MNSVEAKLVDRIARRQTLPKGVFWLKAAFLVGLLAFLYSDILAQLVGDWWKDPNFSHGFLVPLFSAFVVWQNRKRLAALPAEPSWFGLAIVGGALGILIVGELGAEFFLSRSSLVLLIAGLLVYFLGWRHFRAALFPWAFLFFMIPIPALIFNQIAFPLQFLAARLASFLLVLSAVPVLREGNIIMLPTATLEVAQACSGIRSLMSLGALAVVYGYFLESRTFRRLLLALAAIPIAVAANGIRVMGTGLLGYYWDPEKAEGFFHTFSGWVIFIISFVMLVGFHAVMRWTSKKLQRTGADTRGFNSLTSSTSSTVQRIEKSNALKPGARRLWSLSSGWWRFPLVVVLLAGTTLFLRSRGRAENLPPRGPLASFPLRVGSWEGREITIPQWALEVLGAGEFLERRYARTPGEPSVDLFLAYFPSQRMGSTIHSPQNCLPGSGWTPIESTRLQLDQPGGKKLLVNRYILSKGLDRMLVLYWYQAHGRVVASEYWAKFYLVADAIRMNRSDGALVRVLTPIIPSNNPASAEQRCEAFVRDILPLLDNYIPR